jgi:hypothetical protein
MMLATSGCIHTSKPDEPCPVDDELLLELRPPGLLSPIEGVCAATSGSKADGRLLLLLLLLSVPLPAVAAAVSTPSYAAVPAPVYKLLLLLLLSFILLVLPVRMMSSSDDATTVNDTGSSTSGMSNSAAKPSSPAWVLEGFNRTSIPCWAKKRRTCCNSNALRRCVLTYAVAGATWPSWMRGNLPAAVMARHTQDKKQLLGAVRCC